MSPCTAATSLSYSLRLSLSLCLVCFLHLSVVQRSDGEGSIREKAARNRFMVMNYGWEESKLWKQVSVQKFSPTWSASSLLSSLGVPQRGLRIKSNRHASYAYYVRKEEHLKSEADLFERKEWSLELWALGGWLHAEALENFREPIELLVPLKLISQGIKMLLSNQTSCQRLTGSNVIASYIPGTESFIAYSEQVYYY